ncbi:MAG: MotA/TolQ/ExbB proton channel family protein [Gammaproteobacteria bacterium]|nr:MotA/TolQ/ExbB proton channel family protein [Gammaproteobacteria bacterium]
MELVRELIEYLRSGGFVMPPLLMATLLLWYALGYRYAVMLKAGHEKSVRSLVEGYENGKWNKANNIIENAIVEAFRLRAEKVTPLRRYIDHAFWGVEKELSRYQVLVRTIVAITPLLGLLGTVGGMIETFDSLKDMELFSQTGGIAGGISQALVTTQFGLAVAIPGLLVNGYLNRKKMRIEMDLAQIKDLMTVQTVEAVENNL